jgi:hypothetical protein
VASPPPVRELWTARERGWVRLPAQAGVASVNVVEIRGGFEVAIGQAARGGSLRVSASGASSSAIASTCM